MGCGKAKKYNPGGKVKGKSKKKMRGAGCAKKGMYTRGPMA